ncbi:MAG: DivIVA domain-containing protein [Synergistaceae bacterium]|jgi:DivIVA domain-containing protein|nr:DivIVA domain-containing protein [Synergistaceae bacterium]
MSDLLTAKDVELKIFKRASFGGYAIPDVEEFLNQVAEDLEAYVLRQNEMQRRVFELEESLKRHEAMKDTIKDALILAQNAAKEKEDEAKHQAELILAKAQAKIGEFDLQGRRRLEEAENSADNTIAEARATAAQIIRKAEEKEDEARRKLENTDVDVAKRIAEANDRASDITAAARLEARRVTSKVKHEIEESKRELNLLQVEKRHFLRDTSELVSVFAHMLEDAGRKLEKSSQSLDEGEHSPKQEAGRMTLSFSPVVDEADDEVAIS